MEHQLLITDIVNRAFPGPANAILNGLGVSAKDPGHTWTNWMVCEILDVFHRRTPLQLFDPVCP
jgi:hypothetical protein